MEPYAEDWGWEIPIHNPEFKMFIGCGNQQDPSGNHFLCFIEPSKKEIRKGFFRKIDTQSSIQRVADALDQILTSHPDVHDLRWWEENEK